jgi:hypothetical protein
MYFCVVLCTVCFMSVSVLFVHTCVLYYCHQVATQLQLNISYHHTVTHNVISKQKTHFITTSSNCVQYVIISMLKSTKTNFNYILFTVR